MDSAPLAFASSMISSIVLPVPNAPVFSRSSCAACCLLAPAFPCLLILGATTERSTSALLPFHSCSFTPIRSVHTELVWSAVDARTRF